MRSLALAAVLCLTLVPAAFAKAPCRDAKGHFTKCPPAAVATTAATSHMSSMGAMSSMAAHHPACKKGKPCGNSCIAVDKVCHK